LDEISTLVLFISKDAFNIVVKLALIIQ
jgi:hypothetical protein